MVEAGRRLGRRRCCRVQHGAEVKYRMVNALKIELLSRRWKQALSDEGQDYFFATTHFIMIVETTREEPKPRAHPTNYPIVVPRP